MPAWGAPGGGPLTSQQLETIVEYLSVIQLTPEQMEEEVQAGLRESVLKETRVQNPEAAESELQEAYNVLFPGLGDALAEQTAIQQDSEAAVEDIDAAKTTVERLLDDYLVLLATSNAEKYGEYLFNNLDEVYDILNQGREKATLVASEYIDKTRKAMGIAY